MPEPPESTNAKQVWRAHRPDGPVAVRPLMRSYIWAEQPVPFERACPTLREVYMTVAGNRHLCFEAGVGHRRSVPVIPPERRMRRA